MDGDSNVVARLGPYELKAARRYGPRIVGLRGPEGPEILVSLSDEVTVETAGSWTYTFRGGHRLWVSPELEEITYAPDNRPCAITTGSDMLTISGPEDDAGFQKSIEVRWHEGQLVVDHRLKWLGDEPIEVTSWGITQLPLGGVAILPIKGRTMGTSLQADRSLVLWPYTRLDDHRISWRNTVVLIEGAPGPQLKLGSGPTPHRLGYWRGGFLFEKALPDNPDVGRPDRGAVAQVYVNEHFCELESVGPIARLDPGEEVGHKEVWSVDECADVASAVGRYLDSSRT